LYLQWIEETRGGSLSDYPAARRVIAVNRLHVPRAHKAGRSGLQLSSRNLPVHVSGRGCLPGRRADSRHQPRGGPANPTREFDQRIGTYDSQRWGLRSRYLQLLSLLLSYIERRRRVQPADCRRSLRLSHYCG
jgi:hypothetical protein